MRLIGKKVDLRPIQEEDLPELIRWGRNRELQHFMDGEYPKDLGGAHQWLRQAEADRQTKLLAIVTKEDRLIGDIELVHISWRRRECELRIRIGEGGSQSGSWGRCHKDAVVICFFQSSSRASLPSGLQLQQEAIRCYTKCGFRKEGRLRRQMTGSTKSS